MRTPLVMGNWKMHLTHDEGAQLVAALADKLGPPTESVPVEVVVCPPFTSLADVGRALSGFGGRIGLGAQNVHWEASGAYTGEVSVDMLTALGCRYVLVGHSERRSLFAETDAQVARKAKAALAAGLTPVVCVGESLAERRAGNAEAVVGRQLAAILEAVPGQPKSLVVAYEPVWAIGTGEAASPDDAQAIAAFIRQAVESNAVRVLYGGSVQPDNAEAFFAQPDIDGALVGGASLQAEPFARIVEAAGLS